MPVCAAWRGSAAQSSSLLPLPVAFALVQMLYRSNSCTARFMFIVDFEANIIQRWLIASGAVILFFGSTVNRREIKSFASSLLSAQASWSKLNTPCVML